MIELLGLVFGAVARLAPTLFSFLKEGRDLKYEVMRLDKEAELERLRGANARAEIQAASAASVDASWAQAMVEAIRTATPPQIADSGRWYLNVLNALNVSVRPVLTYWWCIVLYTAAKAILVYVAIDGGLALKDMAGVILTDFDRSVVGSIIGFWFVDRALRSGGQK